MRRPGDGPAPLRPAFASDSRLHMDAGRRTSRSDPPAAAIYRGISVRQATMFDGIGPIFETIVSFSETVLGIAETRREPGARRCARCGLGVRDSITRCPGCGGSITSSSMLATKHPLNPHVPWWVAAFIVAAFIAVPFLCVVLM
jgi:hypothetical protein